MIVGENGDFVDRICFGTSSAWYDNYPSGNLGSSGSVTSDPYDFAYHDIGMLPMMFSSGVGANGNISIGVGTVGGMLIGTIALLFIVPVLFIVFQTLQERLMPERKLPKIEENK